MCFMEEITHSTENILLKGRFKGWGPTGFVKGRGPARLGPLEFQNEMYASQFWVPIWVTNEKVSYIYTYIYIVYIHIRDVPFLSTIKSVPKLMERNGRTAWNVWQAGPAAWPGRPGRPNRLSPASRPGRSGRPKFIIKNVFCICFSSFFCYS